MRSVLDAIADVFTWIGADGRCHHSCCPDPCDDPSHVQGEIDWPPLDEQLARAEAEQAKHHAVCGRPGCHTCYVLEGELHDIRLTAELVA